MKFNEIHMFIVWLRTVDFREPGNWVFNHPWCWVSHRHLAKGVSRKSKDLPTYPKGTYPKDPQLEQFMKESDWEFLNQSVFFFWWGDALDDSLQMYRMLQVLLDKITLMRPSDFRFHSFSLGFQTPWVWRYDWTQNAYPKDQTWAGIFEFDITNRIHGTGLFTYMNGRFLWKTRVFTDLCLSCPWFFGERSVRLQVTSFKGIVGDDMKWPPVLLVIVADLCFKWSDLIFAGAGFETICKVGVSFFKVCGITPSRVPAANARNSRRPMAGSPGTKD